MLDIQFMFETHQLLESPPRFHSSFQLPSLRQKNAIFVFAISICYLATLLLCAILNNDM